MQVTPQRIADTHDILGETPVWCAEEEALYWVDVRKPALHRFDMATQAVKSWTMPELIGRASCRERA